MYKFSSSPLATSSVDTPCAPPSPDKDKTAEQRAFRLSVIIPQAMLDPRRQAKFVSSWTKQRNVNPDDYEIVVAADGRDARELELIRSRLRSHDRLVVEPAENRADYYHIAIRAARGQLILLTEDHTTATPECVAETLRFFTETNAKAAFLNSRHYCKTRFGELEAAYSEVQKERHWLHPDCWDRIRLRGSVVDRDVLDRVGGFPSKFNLFAERLLAARLHRAGIKVHYVHEAAIIHFESHSPDDLQVDVREYVQGECHYHREHAEPREEVQLGIPLPFRRSRRWNDNVVHMQNWAILRTLGNFTARKPWTAPRIAQRLVTELAERLPDALIGRRQSLATAWLRLASARRRLKRWEGNKERCLPAFQQFWEAAANFERTKYMVDSPAPIDPLTLPERGASASHELGNCSATRLIGFHQREEYQSRSFRWSEAVGTLAMQPWQGDYEVRIDTGNIRGNLDEILLGVFLNYRAIPQKDIRFEAGGRCAFRIREKMSRPQRTNFLTLVTLPICPNAANGSETRKLGLPILEIAFHPLRPADSTDQDSRKTGLRKAA